MTEFDLLRKTELRIEQIRLENANLTAVAARVAEVLGLGRDEVVVVDYRDQAMTLDVLNACVNAYNIVGKRDALLGALGEMPGVTVSEETSVQSDGMLGWIALDGEETREALRRAEQMASDLLGAISRRAIVFSTGGEVAGGEIEDTNTPAIREYLAAEGYSVTAGPTLPDDPVVLLARLREAAETGGYGLIITTGGVGAEDKDHTVEAVSALDPEAATPYICHYRIGTGRHVKDGVRIAVGEHNGTRIVALPGPNDEVRASLGILLGGLRDGKSKHELAESLAGNLRGILRGKMAAWAHHH